MIGAKRRRGKEREEALFMKDPSPSALKSTPIFRILQHKISLRPSHLLLFAPII
jgi:hypothetical protein